MGNSIRKPAFIGRLEGIVAFIVCLIIGINLFNVDTKADVAGYYGKLYVNGSELTDSNGNPVQLKGISTHGINWFPEYINEECFRQLHNQLGMNVIRLAMYTSEYNGYCTGGNKEELKNLIRNGVQYATDNNMYVIIDWHILSDNNPCTYVNEAVDFFNTMSSEYAGYDNVLYEICNEPNGGTGWQDIKNYANQVMPVIRNNDSDAVIIVGTPNWSQYVNEAAADPLADYSNIMYALHFYAATHTQYLRDTMQSAINQGLPVFVSEYGICDASGNGGIDYYQSEQWIQFMDSYNISYCMWNLSNKQETSSIINSWCNKTSGFTLDELSASGHWLLTMLTGSDELKDQIVTDGLNCDSDGVWRYYDNGSVKYDYTGIVPNEYGWWKITNGQVDFEFTGLASNDSGWWYLNNGKVDFYYNGIVNNEYGWWKITNGQVDFEFTGLASNDSGWWYLNNGKVDFYYNGIVNNEYGWWKVTNGAVDFSYTGLAKNDLGYWYLQNGMVDFTYNGSYEYENTTYNIINGFAEENIS